MFEYRPQRCHSARVRGAARLKASVMNRRTRHITANAPHHGSITAAGAMSQYSIVATATPAA